MSDNKNTTMPKADVAKKAGASDQGKASKTSSGPRAPAQATPSKHDGHDPAEHARKTGK